jgi:dTDP-glucose 4,6-dehydratase
MNVLVTGGYGFIGGHLIRSLKKRGYNSIVYDKQTYACEYVDKKSVPNTWNIKGDILDEKMLGSVFRIHKFDKIFHLAAESHVDNSISDPNIFAHTNIIGTMNVLNLAKQYNKPVVHVSTDEVYGALTGNLESWDENEPLKPNSPYSASKASSDLIALSFCKTYGMDIRVTRCCNNFGIGQHAEKLLPKSIFSAINDKEISIYGDGNNVREWIHAEDHAEGIILVSEKGKSGEVYNIGTGEEISNNEIAKMIAKYTDTSAKIKYITDRPGHDYRYALNFNKIKDLGFSAKRSINDRNEWNEIIEYYKKYQKTQT